MIVVENQIFDVPIDSDGLRDVFEPVVRQVKMRERCHKLNAAHGNGFELIFAQMQRPQPCQLADGLREFENKVVIVEDGDKILLKVTKRVRKFFELTVSDIDDGQSAQLLDRVIQNLEIIVRHI